MASTQLLILFSSLMLFQLTLPTITSAEPEKKIDVVVEGMVYCQHCWTLWFMVFVWGQANPSCQYQCHLQELQGPSELLQGVWNWWEWVLLCTTWRLHNEPMSSGTSTPIVPCQACVISSKRLQSSYKYQLWTLWLPTSFWRQEIVWKQLWSCDLCCWALGIPSRPLSTTNSCLIISLEFQLNL